VGFGCIVLGLLLKHIGNSVRAPGLAGGLRALGAALLVCAATGPALAAAPPAPAVPQTLTINEFTVTGNHILSEEDVDDAVYPYLGPGQTIKSVDEARAALQKIYVNKGFQTVSVIIPPQHVVGGVVTLAVIEAPVGRLRVNGARYFSPNKIKSQAPSLAPGKVPNFTGIKHDIIALNEWPDRQVIPTLQQGVAPHTVDVDLNVKDTLPLHGTLELNNRYNADTSPLRVNASLSYDNLFQRGDTIGLSFQVAPQNIRNALVFSGFYQARVPGIDWLSLQLSGLVSNSNVVSVGSSDVIGKGHQVGLHGLVTLPGGNGFFDQLNAGIDYKDFQQNVSLGGATLPTPITYFPLSAVYSAGWQGDTGLTLLDIGPTFGIRGLGSNGAAFDNKRYFGQGNFIYVRGDLSRQQTLPFGFQALAKTQFQIANEPLINNEQFSAGGQDTVRGYLESEVLGDNAILGSLEIRTPPITLLGPKVTDWRVFAFSEGGQASLLDPLPQQQAIFDLASIGVGSRIELVDHLNGMVDIALPLITSVNTHAGKPRLEFRVWVAF
jgi:hemolysin activation/secretion protein